MARYVSSKVTIYRPAIAKLTSAAKVAMVLTAQQLRTTVVQAQVMPFAQGTLQGEATFIDDSESARGHVYIVSSTPYARRLYYHPEFHFSTETNAKARGRWYTEWLPGGARSGEVPKWFAVFCRKEI